MALEGWADMVYEEEQAYIEEASNNSGGNTGGGEPQTKVKLTSDIPMSDNKRGR